MISFKSDGSLRSLATIKASDDNLLPSIPVSSIGGGGGSYPTIPANGYISRTALLAGSHVVGETAKELEYYADSFLAGKVIEGSFYKNAPTGGYEYRVTNRGASAKPDDWGLVLVPNDAVNNVERSITITGTNYDPRDLNLGVCPDGSPEQVVLRTVRMEISYTDFNGLGPLSLSTNFAGGIVGHGVRKFNDVKTRFITADGTINPIQLRHKLPAYASVTVYYKVTSNGKRLERSDIYDAGGAVLSSIDNSYIEAQCFGVRPLYSVPGVLSTETKPTQIGVNAVSGDHDNAHAINWACHTLKDLRSVRDVARGDTNTRIGLQVTGKHPTQMLVVRYNNYYPVTATHSQVPVDGFYHHDIEFKGGCVFTYKEAITCYERVPIKGEGGVTDQDWTDDRGNTIQAAQPDENGSTVFYMLGEQHTVAKAEDSPYNTGTYKGAAYRMITNRALSSSDGAGYETVPKSVAELLYSGSGWQLAHLETEGEIEDFIVYGNWYGNRGHLKVEHGGQGHFSYNMYKDYIQENDYWAIFSGHYAQGMQYLNATFDLKNVAGIGAPGKPWMQNNHNVSMNVPDGFCALVGCAWPDHVGYAPIGYISSLTTCGYAGRGMFVLSGGEFPNTKHILSVPNPVSRFGNVGGDNTGIFTVRHCINEDSLVDRHAQNLGCNNQESGNLTTPSGASLGILGPYPDTDFVLSYIDMRPPRAHTGEFDSRAGQNLLFQTQGAGFSLLGSKVDGEKGIIVCNARQFRFLTALSGPGAYQDVQIGRWTIQSVGEGLPNGPFQNTGLGSKVGTNHSKVFDIDLECSEDSSIVSTSFMQYLNGETNQIQIYENIDFSAADLGGRYEYGFRLGATVDATLRFIDSHIPAAIGGKLFCREVSNPTLITPTAIGSELIKVEIDGGSVILHENDMAPGTVGRAVARFTNVTDRSNNRVSNNSGSYVLTSQDITNGFVIIDPNLMYEPFSTSNVTHNAASVTFTDVNGNALADRRRPYLRFVLTGLSAGQTLTWSAAVTHI